MYKSLSEQTYPQKGIICAKKPLASGHKNPSIPSTRQQQSAREEMLGDCPSFRVGDKLFYVNEWVFVVHVDAQYRLYTVASISGNMSYYVSFGNPNLRVVSVLPYTKQQTTLQSLHIIYNTTNMFSGKFFLPCVDELR